MKTNESTKDALLRECAQTLQHLTQMGALNSNVECTPLTMLADRAREAALEMQAPLPAVDTAAPSHSSAVGSRDEALHDCASMLTDIAFYQHVRDTIPKEVLVKLAARALAAAAA